MRRRAWIFAFSGLLLAVTGCGHRQVDTPTPTGTPVRVEVTNHYGLPMEIDAVGSGITQRLGTVHPGMSGHFVMPQNLSEGTVEFQAHPTARGPMYRSGQILLVPGDIVDFDIAAILFSSKATVRN